MVEAASPQSTSDLSGLCTSCPIALRVGECRAVHPKYHAENPLKYLVWGEAPGKDEDQGLVVPNPEGGTILLREPFQGPAGSLLRERIHHAGIALTDCLFTNSAWCAPRPSAEGQIATPDLGEADHCSPHSLDLIRKYRPKMVIAAGDVALTTLCGFQRKPNESGRGKGKKIGITELRGRYLPMNPSLWARYWTFRRALPEVTIPDDLQDYFAEVRNPRDVESGAEFCSGQINKAVEEGLYDETFLDTPVLVVVHPSFALRHGRFGHWAEMLQADLEKAKRRVENIAIEHDPVDYRWINDLEGWKAYVDETIQLYEDGKIRIVAGDVETSEEGNDAGSVGLMAFDPRVKLWTIQFSRYEKEGVAVMVNHKKSNFNDPASFQMFRHHLKRLFDAVPMVFHNAVFDVHTIYCRLGIKPRIVADTMLMDHWYNAGKKMSAALDQMGARYCRTYFHKEESHAWREQYPGKTFEDMPLEIGLAYAAGDTDITLRCYNLVRSELEKQERWEQYYDLHHGQHHGWDVINDVEYWGWPCDRKILDWLSEEYPKRIEECIQRIHTNPIVGSFCNKLRKKWNQETIQYNEDIKGSRKRPRKTYDNIVDWIADEKKRFNPNSPKQVLALWTGTEEWPGLRDGKGNLLFKFLPDIEYNDSCPRCGRDGHKCNCKGERYVPTIPKTNEHNRSVMTKFLRRWANECEERGDITSQAAWAHWAEYLEAHDEFKMLTKMYGTYVGARSGKKGATGMYKVIIDKAELGDDYDPAERCFYLYKPYCRWPEPWVVHASYLMHGTETGRLSSRDPNGQNFPKGKLDKKANVKAPYISRWRSRGGLIVQPDYSQIEVRIMVILSGDERMSAAINAGKDIHTFNAAMIHRIPEEKVTKDLRDPIKTTTFGIIYGQSVQAMASNLGMTIQEAQAIQDTFFAECPALAAFKESQQAFVKKYGFVDTLFGRRRYLPHVISHLRSEREKAMRDAVNTPIQSVASDLCWSAFGRSWRMMQEIGIEAHPYSIIHDSQGFDVAPGSFMDVVELQYYQMVYKPYELWDWLTVKPDADFDIGTGLGDLIGLKLFWGDDGELDHNRIALSGPRDTIEIICAEIDAGGQSITQEEDGPHPKEEEAKKGLWYRKIHVDRPNPRCLLRGRKLEIVA